MNPTTHILGSQFGRTLSGRTPSCRTVRRSRGFTLIDFMIVITILGILASQGVPSWTSAFARKKLQGEADSIASAIQLARLETVARNSAVSVSILQAPSGASCHVVHTGASSACACADDGTASCGVPGAVLTAAIHDPSVRATLARSIRFDPRTGSATPTGTVTIRSTAGHEIQNRVAITGRVRTCQIGAGIPGVAAC
jgi:type IV fimbrial biogenesis protein FimT